MSTPSSGPFHQLRAENLRRYPRVSVSVPVEVRSGKLLVVGRSRNVSLGGLCMASPLRGIVGDVALRFTLPGGLFVTALGKIVSQDAQGGLGICFNELPPEQFALLAMSLQTLLGYTKSGTRIASRLVVTLRPRAGDATSEEFAETQYVSRNGALVICRANFRVNEKLFLWWPEKGRGLDVHVIYRRQSGYFNELGLVFDEEQDFWGIAFREAAKAS